MSEFHQKQFSISRKDGRVRFVAEMSELSFGAGSRGVFRQVFPDSCDAGLTLVTARGNEVDYYVREEKRDREGEGELQVTVLVPTPQALRRCPAARGSEVHILND
jgi:hypothetical protein